VRKLAAAPPLADWVYKYLGMASLVCITHITQTYLSPDLEEAVLSYSFYKSIHSCIRLCPSVRSSGHIIKQQISDPASSNSTFVEPLQQFEVTNSRYCSNHGRKNNSRYYVQDAEGKPCQVCGAVQNPVRNSAQGMSPTNLHPVFPLRSN
jgi:hypothetical protein